MTGLGRLVAIMALFSAPCSGWTASSPPVEADHGMVVTAQHYASRIGVDILRRGGNAIDAAVAVGYALAVVHPCCGNIGGGGFATIHLAGGKDVFIDFREKAPEAAFATMFLDAEGNVVPRLSLDGYRSAAVPGTVLGLDTMLNRYGTLGRRDVMAPAISLAQDGYVLAPGDVELLDMGARHFLTQPNVAAIFLNHGRPWEPGETLRQRDLAASR
jgi:gamma-glutamyltranspeptidase/glutathione hydrolase